MSRFAHKERVELANLLDEVGDYAPTLCNGWNTYDLAAHLVARERRFDAGPGLLLPAAAGWTDRVRRRVKDKYEYRQLVYFIRNGPPLWSPLRIPAVNEMVNTVEFFVHHEDVRRAQSSWTTRELHHGMEEILWRQLRRIAPRLLRKAPCGVLLNASGVDQLVISDVPETTPLPANEFVAVDKTPRITVQGLPSELLLYCYGRTKVARVQEYGDHDALSALHNTKLGY